MTNLLIDLPVYLGLPLFMIIIVIIGTVIYKVAYQLMEGRLGKNHERVGRVLFRTSASLLALILSFTFANQRVNYFKLKNSLEMEAAKLVDIYMDLEIYDDSHAQRTMEKIRKYVVYITEDGWESLHEDPFRSPMFQKFREIYLDLHQLPEETRLQEELKSNITADIEEVSDYLQIRIYVAGEKSNNLVYTAAFGFFIICILFAVYPPDGISMIFLGLYNAFVGIVLYFILMMANPLLGPLKIEPEPFQILRLTIENGSAFL